MSNNNNMKLVRFDVWDYRDAIRMRALLWLWLFVMAVGFFAYNTLHTHNLFRSIMWAVIIMIDYWIGAKAWTQWWYMKAMPGFEFTVSQKKTEPLADIHPDDEERAGMDKIKEAIAEHERINNEFFTQLGKAHGYDPTKYHFHWHAEEGVFKVFERPDAQDSD